MRALPGRASIYAIPPSYLITNFNHVSFLLLCPGKQRVVSIGIPRLNSMSKHRNDNHRRDETQTRHNMTKSFSGSSSQHQRKQECLLRCCTSACCDIAADRMIFSTNFGCFYFEIFPAKQLYTEESHITFLVPCLY